jgi:hypothetical protein
MERSRAAIPLAALLIISLVLNGITTNVQVKAQTQPPNNVSGNGSGTITYSPGYNSCPANHPPYTPIQAPGGIGFAAYFNPDGTLDTNVGGNSFTLQDSNGNYIYTGTATAGRFDGSSFSITYTYRDCGPSGFVSETATISGTCGTNLPVTFDSTGTAAFAGTGNAYCVGPPTHTTITSATDSNGNPVTNGGSTYNTKSITFQVTATSGGEPIAGYQCSLDGGAFSTCASTNPGTISYTVPPLTVGLPHTVKIKAIDTQGRTDPNPATFTWTFVRPEPPRQTTITSATDGNGNPVQNGNSTVSTSITFQFTAIEGSNPITGYQCSLDGGAFSTCASTNPGTVSYNNLVAGQQHTFAVRAVDSVGNKDLKPATFSWTVLTPTQAIQKLINTIDSMQLPTGTTTSLEASLNAAMKQLDRNNQTPACNQLNAFLNKVSAKQTSGELTAQQAADLSQQATAIQRAIGCSNIGSNSSPTSLPLPMP